MAVRQCHQCGAEWNREGAVGFNHTCDKCHVWIHSCRNCKYLLDSKCRNELATDRINDLAAKNFCEEFRFREKDAGIGWGRPNGKPGGNSTAVEDNARRQAARDELRKLLGD